jgi:hypothetical protein
VNLIIQRFQPVSDLFPDGLPDLSGLFQFFILGSSKSGGISKTPVKTGGDAREERTTLGVGLVTDRDHMGKQSPLFKKIKGAFGLISGNIKPDLPHNLHGQRDLTAPAPIRHS